MVTVEARKAAGLRLTRRPVEMESSMTSMRGQIPSNAALTGSQHSPRSGSLLLGVRVQHDVIPFLELKSDAPSCLPSPPAAALPPAKEAHNAHTRHTGPKPITPSFCQGRRSAKPRQDEDRQDRRTATSPQGLLAKPSTRSASPRPLQRARTSKTNSTSNRTRHRDAPTTAAWYSFGITFY